MDLFYSYCVSQVLISQTTRLILGHLHPPDRREIVLTLWAAYPMPVTRYSATTNSSNTEKTS